MSKEEQVLGVPVEVFNQVGSFQGFCPESEPYLTEFFDFPFSQFRLRSEVEEDPTFKQIIPYCLLIHGDRVLVYQRGASGGEGRLKAKHSIGIGGHINPIDADGDSLDLVAYENAVQRELLEELSIKSAIVDRRVIGILNDDSNPVGQVHLGVVEAFYLAGEDVTSNEDSISNIRFVPFEELTDGSLNLENWSAIVVKDADIFLDDDPVELLGKD